MLSIVSLADHRAVEVGDAEAEDGERLMRRKLVRSEKVDC